MLKGNHHMIDKRALKRLIQMIKEKVEISKNSHYNINGKEAQERLSSILESLSSIPYLINLLNEIAK
jgi:hypothetical protein